MDRSLWRAAPAPRDALLMCVVIPVRNEGVALASTLASVAAQRTLAGEVFDLNTIEVLVLANNCTDNSAAVGRAFAATHPCLPVHVAEVDLPPEQANIGHVRRLMMDAACRRLECATPDGLLISTDGDTMVDPLWLANTVLAFEAGADVVGGRILLDPKVAIDAATLRHQRCDTVHQLAQSRLEDLLDPDPADPWPRHHQHFCASLALRTQAYRRVGGVPDVRFLEDVALVDACRLADLHVRHSPLVRVRTSPRQEGRVEVGLSWQLRQWSQSEAAAEPMQVEDPDVFVARVKRRRVLREAWQQTGSKDVCAAPGIAQTFGAFWLQIQETSRAAVQAPEVPVREAITRLKALICEHSGATQSQHTTPAAMA